REGFTEAARELLPEVKKEVAEGFKDALSSAMGGELMDRTAQVAAKTGASFMETGLNILLGKPPERKKD
ncbi:MAG: hypothetical protein HY042_00760, partial [Spirochaetia bacterium]|nr:hypothetical protein [Spirochaetia bacterium]